MPVQINEVTAIIAVIMMMMVCVGYYPLIRGDLPKWARLAVIGVVIGCVGAVLRLGYWDIIQMVSGDRWPEIRAALGAQKASSLFNLFSISAGYMLLRARVFIVRKEDRKGWYWFNAWLHPNDKFRFFKSSEDKQ